MAPTRLPANRSGLERVREELLTALHFGRLSPGDRAPSVRRLADRTGMNRKTVHRAYTRLAREGFLNLRPGSGTFIAEQAHGNGEATPAADLLRAANRCRAAAESLGLAPDVFSAFVDIYLAGGLRNLPLAVVECNRDQLELISSDLKACLGLSPRPVLLSDFSADPRAATAGSWGVVTTDCHHAEVAERSAAPGMPVFRVALDPVFPQKLLEQARRSEVIMVVEDAAFAPVFRRLLRQLAPSPDLVRRVSIVEPAEALTLLRNGNPDAVLHVSPRLEKNLPESLLSGRPRLRGRWHIEPSSLDRLKASLALDLALRRRPG